MKPLFEQVRDMVKLSLVETTYIPRTGSAYVCFTSPLTTVLVIWTNANPVPVYVYFQGLGVECRTVFLPTRSSLDRLKGAWLP